MSDNTVHVNTTPYAFILFTVFLVLKLTGVISWSWWWVTAPLWLPAVFAMFLIVVLVLVVTVRGGYKRTRTGKGLNATWTWEDTRK